MTINFGDILYIDTPYRPQPESFCKSKGLNGKRYKVGQWYICRELFHSILYNLKLFFFSHNLGKGHCIAAFMKKIEELSKEDIINIGGGDITFELSGNVDNTWNIKIINGIYSENLN